MDPKKTNLEELLESLMTEVLEDLKKDKQEEEKECEEEKEEIKPIGPMPFEQALGIVRKAYTNLGKEFVFWTDEETIEKTGRKIYFFTYMKNSPVALCAFFENEPEDLWITDITGTLLTKDWYIEELED